MKLPVNGIISIVTGSAGSLGSRVRQKLAINGSKILALDINHKTEVEEDTELKGRVSFITGDVSDEKLLTRVWSTYKTCDAVVHCAAASKPYYYITSYIVAKNALQVMRQNEINKGGVRGCIINVNILPDKYTEAYFEEQERFAKAVNVDLETLDDRVMELAQQLTDARIRCNTIQVPKGTDELDFAQIVLSILEDQQLAGKIINMEDNVRQHVPELGEIFNAIHTPPKPLEKQLQLEKQLLPDSLKHQRPKLLPLKKIK